MKKLLVILACLLGFGLYAASPASAYPTTRHLYHYAPDDGYDRPIYVTCDWDAKTIKTVYEGNSLSCNMEGVYVHDNQQIKCYEGAGIGWQIVWDATGWHKSNYAPLYGCVDQAD